MATAKTLEVVIVGDTARYTSAINKAVTSTTKLSTAQKTAGTSATKMGDQAAASAAKAASRTTALGGSLNYVKSLAGQAGAAFVGFLGAQAVISGVTRVVGELSRAVVDFDRNMRNVNSLLGQSEPQLQRMGDAVLDLSKELPQTASELSAGLYDVVSSGFQGADALSVLRASATAASAGLTDTATSGKAIAGVLNAYGLSAAHAQEVSDILFQTVNLGVISFEELAGTVGDFVGTAAALGVPIEDASSALATMTLSGISAEEASTSLNRVMLALIKPSAQMTALLKSWGFESGTAAVQTLGLRGVMEKIRISTGGTSDSMAGLFEETRGLKGALALLSGDGENYRRVTEGMGKATEGAGASARVLEEQSKSLGFQLDIAKNQIMAVGIEAGRWLGPRIAEGLSILGDIAGDVGDVLAQLWRGAQPGIEALSRVFGDLVEIGRDLFDAVAPIATLFGQIAGASIVALFNSLATAVSIATGFLRDHSYIVVALAVLYAGQLVSSIGAAVGAFLQLRAARIADTFAAGAQAVGRFADKLLILQGQAGTLFTLRAGLSGIVGALTSPLAILAGLGVVLHGISSSLSDAKGEAEEWSNAWLKNEDTKHIEGLDRAIAKARDRFHEARGAAREFDGVIGGIRHVEQNLNPFEANQGQETASRAQAALDTLRRLVRERENLMANLRKVGGKAATDQELVNIQRFGDAIGVDLNAKGEKGRQAIQLTKEAIRTLGDQAGYSKAQLGAGLFDAKALEEEAAAAQEFAESVRKSFLAAGDVIAALGDDKELTGAKIEEFYSNAITKTSAFLANIEEAYRQGFDPALVTRLLGAGPDQAGALLEQLVGQHSGAFVDMVNNAEAELIRMSQAAVEIARLQEKAMKAPTDTIAAMLPDAIRVSAEKARQGAAATTESLAAALHLTPSQVTEIAASYGISIPGPQVTVSVDKLVAETDMEEFRAVVDAVPTLVTTEPNVNDPDDVKKWWDDLRVRLLLIPGLRDTVAQITDPQQAWAWWSELKTRIDLVPGEKNTWAHVFDEATPILEALTNYEIPKKWVNVGIDTSGLGGVGAALFAGFGIKEADGGIVRFANGSESHVAQIARPGAMRLWAEPETGGEAYIPLAPSKRARSARILMAVADQFGMARYAAGGMTNGQWARGDQYEVTVNVDARSTTDPAATRQQVEGGVAVALERVQVGRRMRRT